MRSTEYFDYLHRSLYLWMTDQVGEKLNKTEITVAHRSLSCHLKEVMRET